MARIAVETLALASLVSFAWMVCAMVSLVA